MTMLGRGFLGVCSAAAAVCACLFTLQLSGGGLFLAGWAVPPDQDQWQPWLQRIASKAEAREVVLRGDAETMLVSLAEVGFFVDQEQTGKQLALSACAPGGGADDLIQRLRAKYKACPDVPLSWRYDADAAEETLRHLASAFSTPAVDASLDFAARRRVMHQSGYKLGVEASVARLAELDPERDDQVTLHLEPVEPRVRLVDLPDVDPTKVLASYQTDFRKKRGPRMHNIRVAARYLNGSIIEPGATLSFNKSVGVRTGARGFIDAPVIVNDEMESGMGGGVCQVATTLHGAAIYGALEVKERRSHSRPSGYAPLGLDATVIDGVQDLKLRNPYDVPVYVRAYLPSKYVIRVELLGVERPGDVSHKFWVVKRHDYTRRVVEKPELTPGTIKRNQKGGYGYDTVSKVVLTREDGTQQERHYRSKYYPVPEVLWVGPGTPHAELPPASEEARVAAESVSL